MASQAQYSTAEAWLKARIGNVPSTSTGWFRAGVGFYNKREYAFAIQCFEKAIALDPQNYNAYQVMSRACIAVNRRDLAIVALKESVKLNNPSDWQLLVELTNQEAELRQKDQQQQAAAAAAAAADADGQ